VASIKRRFVIIVKLQTASGARGCKAPRRRSNFVDVAGDDHAHLSNEGGACGARPKTSLAALPELCPFAPLSFLPSRISRSVIERFGPFPGIVLAISAGADRPWTVGKRAGVKSGERKKMIINRSLDTSQ
jgi:hypothetical protein